MKYDTLSEREGVNILWRGTVRLSQSFIESMTEPVAQDGVKIYTICDCTFDKEDNAQFDNPGLQKDFPNRITVALKGDKVSEFMKCSAFTRQEHVDAKRFARPAKRQKTTTKGFVLEPLQEQEQQQQQQQPTTPIHDACLSIFQFDNRNSSNQTVVQFNSVDLKPSLAVEKLGCIAFASGSQGSSVTFSKDPKKSVTILYAASDQKPFVARLDTNQDRRWVVGKSDGVEIKIDDHAEQLQTTTKRSDDTPTLDEALKILNIRLAKGEITIYEYENLRQVMENRTGRTSTNWGV